VISLSRGIFPISPSFAYSFFWRNKNTIWEDDYLLPRSPKFYATKSLMFHS
jgi:hypothetical protein